MNARTGRVVGILFILGTASGSVSAALLSPILEGPELLPQAAEHPTQLLLGVVCILIMAFSLAMIPVFAYPVLRERSEVVALGYFLMRGAVETLTYVLTVLSWLVLLAVARSADVGEASQVGYDVMTELFIRVDHAIGQVVTVLVFSLGALLFYYALFRYRFVPRWLSGWGLLAATLWLGAGVMVMFSVLEPWSTLQILLAIPIAVQELVLAVWLIVRGFNTAAPEGP